MTGLPPVLMDMFTACGIAATLLLFMWIFHSVVVRVFRDCPEEKHEWAVFCSAFSFAFRVMHILVGAALLCTCIGLLVFVYNPWERDADSMPGITPARVIDQPPAPTADAIDKSNRAAVTRKRDETAAEAGRANDRAVQEAAKLFHKN